MRLLCFLLCLVTAPQCECLQCQTWVYGDDCDGPCSVPGAAAGVGPRTGEALIDPVPHLYSITSGYYCNWIQQPPGKGLESHTSISKDTSKNQFSLQLSSVTTKDMAMYYCARDTVSGSQCEPRHKPPCRVGGGVGLQGALMITSVCSGPMEHRDLTQEQVQLQESGPGLVKPSRTLSLTCAVSGSSITTCYHYWSWVRQPPGKSLEYMGHIYSNGNTNYKPSLTTWISISIGTSKNQFSLQLNLVTAEDTVMYYCARHRDGKSVSAHTQTSLQEYPRDLAAGGTHDHQGALRISWGRSRKGGLQTSLGMSSSAPDWFRGAVSSVRSTVPETLQMLCSSCYNHILSSHFPERCHCHQTPPGLSHLLWGTVLAETSNPRACYTVRGHGYRALPLLMKTSPAPTLQLWRGDQPRDSQVFPLDSVKGQFTISRDNSKNTLGLKMNSLRTEATAIYYCGTDTARGSQWVPRHKPPCRRGPGPPGGAQDVSSDAWSWIRQPPGKGLDWIGCIYFTGSTYYNPSLESRTSISRDAFKNQFSLQLSSATTEDTAVYYCAGDTDPPSAEENQPSPDPAALERRPSPGIPRCSHLVIRTEHRPHTMEFALSWVFLFAILRGNLWRTRDIEHLLHKVTHQAPANGLQSASSIKYNGYSIRDNAKNTLYLQMNSLRTEDTAMYDCAKDTVREIRAGLHGALRAPGGTLDQQRALRTNRGRSGPTGALRITRVHSGPTGGTQDTRGHSGPTGGAQDSSRHSGLTQH
ncbi:hypothetical protein HPG69_006834 [Diceros bicornis minor]|uniref:Ig-like domain-containing protein n=1 Tax=Diceros bicornis minor TaxID=77932 RepID=A0A7J7EKW4_DICBM|nr:hypothetical protein HPG69_006834 [Diceros bicornis minor]